MLMRMAAFLTQAASGIRMTCGGLVAVETAELHPTHLAVEPARPTDPPNHPDTTSNP